MKKSVLFVTAMCLLMTSCLSNNVVKVERVVVPELDFPEFPKIQRTVNSDGSWLISKQSADNLADFYLRYQKTETAYESLKKIYKNFYGESNDN